MADIGLEALFLQRQRRVGALGLIENLRILGEYRDFSGARTDSRMYIANTLTD